MGKTPIEPASEILGYQLEKRIGSGGFGEVWAAEAPGGLKKAIKIVYGFHDEKRAQAEIKALDRVKSLRHPFLLSLERIEIFEDQLIVVTELADGSMADIFNHHVQNGEVGIPRDELLRYVSNAAAALDFLATEKSLQHLDVKPENMLIVSGHVKVGDFGLMKDLNLATQSLMQGMTPAYAPPELFDGQPATTSDQYSLAVLYTEMLTGVRPFPGTTPAQLAAQHMHGKPNLRPLPKGDQPAVARALSKDPSTRHTSCVAFVEDLKKQRRIVRKALRRSQTTSREALDTGSETCLHGDGPGTHDVTEMFNNGFVPKSEQIALQSPPSCGPEQSTLSPTLIITVGDTANRVGQKIKAKLLARAGNEDEIPAIQSVYIDSDTGALGELESMRTNPVSPLETVSVPLRRSEDYRNDTKNHLSWLSRRWIYNIPRTQQTEGLRPLGRLVFADHFNSICDSLERSIEALTKVENLATTCESLKMMPGEPAEPQVYIITSISGGIGSGMTLDLAYALKLLLAEKGLRDDNINGILLHSCYSRQRDPGLAAANAFAFLTEFRHFNEYGYPGDENLGIPEFEEEQPFSNTYFVELGDDLCQSDYDKKLSEVAEYVSLTSASKCSSFFQSCRANDFEREHFALRSFGLSVNGAGGEYLVTAMLERLGQKLVNRWINSSPDVDMLNTNVSDLVSKFDLNRASMVGKIEAEAERLTRTSRQELVREISAIAKREKINPAEALVNHLDSVFGVPTKRRDASHVVQPDLAAALDQFVTEDSIAGELQLANKIMGLVDSRGICISSVNQIADSIVTHLEGIADEVRATLEENETHTASIIHNLLLTASGASEATQFAVAQLSEKLTSLRHREFVIRYSLEYLRVVRNSIDPVRARMSQFKSNLEMVRSSLTRGRSFDFDLDVETEEFDLERMMVGKIESSINELASKTELQVFHTMVEEAGSFSAALANQTFWRHHLPEQIRTAAHGVLRNAFDSLSIDDVIREGGVLPEQLVKWLNEQVAEARPRVGDCGGEMRLLMGYPTYSENPELSRVINAHLNLESCSMQGTYGNLVICFEAEDISFAGVAFRLLAQRPDAVELVKRIRTRDDVQWTTLDDLF